MHITTIGKSLKNRQFSLTAGTQCFKIVLVLGETVLAKCQKRGFALTLKMLLRTLCNCNGPVEVSREFLRKLTYSTTELVSGYNDIDLH